MNQKQREYTVRELETIQRVKIKEIRDSYVDNLSGNNSTSVENMLSLVSLHTALKNGKLKRKPGGELSDNSSNPTNCFTHAYATSLLNSGIGFIDKIGNYRISVGEFGKAFKVATTSDLKKIDTLDSWDSNKSLGVVISMLKYYTGNGASITNILNAECEADVRIAAVRKAFKKAERGIMLSDGDELIKAIEKFEKAKF